VSDNWEILSRKTNHRGWYILALLCAGFLFPDLLPLWQLSVTWVLRKKSTGEIRSVTARSEEEMRATLALLDKDAVR
jgi:hypothetical protein